MWRWAVLCQATLLAVSATLDFRFFQRRPLPAVPTSATQVNCFEYVLPNMNDRYGRANDKGWRPHQKSNAFPSSTAATSDPLLNTNEISRRIDFLLPDAQDIVKEHAKLVQDINSLRQVVFVSPLADDNRDYDDSIFHEIIETSTTTQRPTTTRPMPRATKPTLPVILVGGASQRQVVRTPPIRLAMPKPTISLVGTSISPLMKHPYPFVMQEPRKPIKVCMTAMPMMYATTRRPSLWQRLLSSLIPR